MEQIQETTKFQFIPTEVILFTNIRKIKMLYENDVFEKCEAIIEVKGGIYYTFLHLLCFAEMPIFI